MKVTPQLTKKRIDLGAQIPLSTPLVLYVEASSFCNLECTFCPHHLDPKNLNKANMEFSIFKKIIDDLQFFESDLQMLRMCGTGDPLFNKDLPSMLDYATAHRKFKKFELITNGLLINEAKNLEALTSNLSRLIISIEGLSDEDYQKFTNRNVRFLNFVKKLKKLYERRQGCKIHIKIHNSVVMEMQRRELFFEIFSDICDEIYIENLVDLWPETDSSYVPKTEHRFDEQEIDKITVCSQIFKTMQINSDGSVIPCSIDWQAKNNLGNIKDFSLKELWNGDTIRELRLKHLKGMRFNFSPCANCSFNEFSDTDNIDESADSILKRIDTSQVEKADWVSR